MYTRSMCKQGNDGRMTGRRHVAVFRMNKHKQEQKQLQELFGKNSLIPLDKLLRQTERDGEYHNFACWYQNMLTKDKEAIIILAVILRTYGVHTSHLTKQYPEREHREMGRPSAAERGR
ncbi:hypothetical protein D8B26_006185 [Coccidioides posadasii str. Silveira]|uniref:uncharacterized protein n=1 Tax=Coccidioides posadasii (strain RMSCC 757 / Silveira) TaxID=443226 RepID=UPI001BEEFEB4|nr:hypothetical protein D8B26_006185 [Coccidioides posadasii str. Silveira]